MRRQRQEAARREAERAEFERKQAAERRRDESLERLKGQLKGVRWDNTNPDVPSLGDMPLKTDNNTFLTRRDYEPELKFKMGPNSNEALPDTPDNRLKRAAYLRRMARRTQDDDEARALSDEALRAAQGKEIAFETPPADVMSIPVTGEDVTTHTALEKHLRETATAADVARAEEERAAYELAVARAIEAELRKKGMLKEPKTISPPGVLTAKPDPDAVAFTKAMAMRGQAEETLKKVKAERIYHETARKNAEARLTAFISGIAARPSSSTPR
jgi:hypothetical protein